MKGKILDSGVISGEDGHRYGFDLANIKNLEGRNIQSLVGSEVDFEIDGENAISIYITSTSFANNLLSQNTKSIKTKFFIAIGCVILSVIPFIGFLFSIAGFVFTLLAVIALNKAAQSTTLLRNYLISIGIGIGGFVIAGILGGASLVGMVYSSGSLESINIEAIVASGSFIVAMIVGVIATIGMFVFMLLFMRELAYITNQKLFLYAIYTTLIGGLTLTIFIGYAFMIASFVMYIIALVKFQEIRPTSKQMPWF